MKLGTAPAIAPGQIDNLMEYNWPGNVRELENAVERALILFDGEQLIFENFTASSQKNSPAAQIATLGLSSYNLDEAMSTHIKQVLKITQGKIHGPGGAAELLEINPMTLRHRMKKLKIAFGRKHKKLQH